MQKYQLGLLQCDNPNCYNTIQSAQPFVNAVNHWLTNLCELTKDKHESYVEIASSVDNEMRIGLGQCGTIKQMVIGQEGRIYADADMKDSRSGRPAPLRLTFTERFNHVLRVTGTDPITFCSRCVDHVESLFKAVMRSISNSRR